MRAGSNEEALVAWWRNWWIKKGVRMLTQYELKAALNYNKTTGEFTKVFKNGKTRRAGSIGQDYQRRISVNGKKYPAKNLAWLYCYGVYPKFTLYHKNGGGDDDRIDNLSAGIKGAQRRCRY